MGVTVMGHDTDELLVAFDHAVIDAKARIYAARERFRERAARVEAKIAEVEVMLKP